MNKRRIWRQLYGILVGSICLLVFFHNALADWSVAGAQYSCSTASGIFVLLPFDKSSDEPNPHPEKGFKVLSKGTSNLKCSLGKRSLQAQIIVTPPLSHGMCMGCGSVDISSLVVDGIELLTIRLPFNWNCPGSEEVLEKVRIMVDDSSVKFEQCVYKPSNNINAPAKTKCSIKLFDIDAIAATNSKLDHRLVDLSVQASQSATRLPPENDLAKVFANAVSKEEKIPLCAHWSSTFLNALVSPEKQRYGFIAGTEGEKVYIHPTNPQLCHNPNDDGCTARAYLLPGDRIDIGFLCGDWTHIQYRSRILTQPPIKGWVETSRVYGIHPAITNVESSMPVPLSRSQATPSDALLQAVASKNSEQAKHLIAAGANPNGRDNSGIPLADAIKNGDLNMVRTLIKMGASVNFSSSKKFDNCYILKLGIENQNIFDALVKARIDLNCRSRNFGSTQLMEIANYNRLWAWERIHTSENHKTEHLLDPMLLAKRLLKAGADPNVRDHNGRTALFYAMQANNIDVAKLLLDSGANPNIYIDSYQTSASEQTGSTPLMEAFHWYPLTNDPTIFQLLLAYGANQNYRNSHRYNKDWDETTSGAVTFAGQTVLTRAAEDGFYTLARMLLENGANPNISREDGALPETIAKNYKHPKTAALISDYVRKWQVKKTHIKMNKP